MPGSSKRSLVLLLAALPLFAQTGTPTFKSATNLVEATAVVRDAQGNAVGDLTADDFQLFDTGKRQVISRFAVEKLQSRELTPVPGGNPALPGPPPAASALPSHFVAFVVDDQNLVPE